MKFLLNILSLLVIGLLLPQLTTGAGIKVSPSKLTLQIPAGRTSSLELTVSNPTSDVQIFEVYPDDFDEYVSALPSSFTLEAGGTKPVRVAVDTRNHKTEAVLQTNLSVVGKPLAEARFQANSGIKIPVQILITRAVKSRPVPTWALPTTVAAILVIIVAYPMLPKRLWRRPRLN